MEIEAALCRKQGIVESVSDAGSDQALARKIAAGDLDAWDRFFDRYSSWSYSFAYRHLNSNHADAQDLCSDIMLTAAKSIGSFDFKRGCLDAWLHGLARNRLCHFCRSRRIELPLIPDIIDHSSHSDSASFDISDITHTKDVVNRSLASIPCRQAEALIGKYVEGYTTEELALQMGISVKAAESLLFRARESFRSVFESLMADDLGGDNLG